MGYQKVTEKKKKKSCKGSKDKEMSISIVGAMANSKNDLVQSLTVLLPPPQGKTTVDPR